MTFGNKTLFEKIRIFSEMSKNVHPPQFFFWEAIFLFPKKKKTLLFNLLPATGVSAAGLASPLMTSGAIQ